MTVSEIERLLIGIMVKWDPAYLKSSGAKERIKKEISFFGWDSELEEQVFDYIDHHTSRILNMVRNKAHRAGVRSLRNSENQ